MESWLPGTSGWSAGYGPPEMVTAPSKPGPRDARGCRMLFLLEPSS